MSLNLLFNFKTHVFKFPWFLCQLQIIFRTDFVQILINPHNNYIVCTIVCFNC